MTDRSRLMRTVVATITFVGLAVGYLVLAPAPAAEAAGTSTCHAISGAGGTPPDQTEWDILFVYNRNSASFCSYTNQRSWMEGARDGVARGAASGEYLSMEVLDVRPNGRVAIEVTFSGQGKTASVNTSYGAAQEQEGASNWASSARARCSDPFIPAIGREAPMLRDFFYHIGQVVKSNSSGYSGPKATGAQLSGASDTRVEFDRGCSSPV